MKNDGFHLIEILITLSLVAIMSHLMIERYQHFIVETRRKEAVQALHMLASAMENYAIEHSTYSGADFTKLKINPHISGGNYILIINHAHNDGYLLSANPLSHQADADKHCGTIKLSSTGELSVTGTATDC
jgi:Tfp pilus assembly protein PilE